MNLLTALHTIVSQLRSRRNQTHGGAHAADSESETLSEPTTSTPAEWTAGQELQERAEEVDRVESTVRIIGSSSDEWIEGSSVEVQR